MNHKSAFYPFDIMILIFFSLIMLFNTLYFLNDSCLQELGEGTVAQWVVALINLTYSEHMYIGLTVLVLFLLSLSMIT